MVKIVFSEEHLICREPEEVVIICESYIKSCFLVYTADSVTCLLRFRILISLLDIYFFPLGGEAQPSYTREKEMCGCEALTQKYMDMNIFTVNGNANVRLNEVESRIQYCTI